MRALLFTLIGLTLASLSCSRDAESVERPAHTEAPVPSRISRIPQRFARQGQALRMQAEQKRRMQLFWSLLARHRAEVLAEDAMWPHWPASCGKACRRARRVYEPTLEALSRESLFINARGLNPMGERLLAEVADASRHGVEERRLSRARALELWTSWSTQRESQALLELQLNATPRVPWDLERALAAQLHARLQHAEIALSAALDRALLEAFCGLERSLYARPLGRSSSGVTRLTRVLESPQSWSEHLDTVVLPFAEYRALGEHLRRYRHLTHTLGALTPVPLPRRKQLAEGDSGPLVAALRERLREEGFLEGEVDEPTRFGAPLRAGLERFQTMHNIEPTGVLDKTTARVLNQPLCHKVGLLEVALRQWRESPLRTVKGRVVVWTNLAGYVTDLFVEHQRTQRQISAVGLPHKATPRFVTPIKIIQMNPPWGGTRTLKVYEPPGPESSLGRAALRLPEYPWPYLFHGSKTPEDFDKVDRRLSLGCVRLEHPERLASEILRLTGHEDGPAWVEAAMDDPEYTTISRRISPGIPAITDYIVAGVTEAGELRFYGDPYFLVPLRGYRKGKTCPQPVAEKKM